MGCTKYARGHARFTETCDGRNEGVNWSLCLPSGQFCPLFLSSTDQLLVWFQAEARPCNRCKKALKTAQVAYSEIMPKKIINKQTPPSKLFRELSTDLSQVDGSERHEDTFWKVFHRCESSYLDQFNECKNKGKQMKTVHIWRYTYSWHNLPQRKTRFKCCDPVKFLKNTSKKNAMTLKVGY